MYSAIAILDMSCNINRELYIDALYYLDWILWYLAYIELCLDSCSTKCFNSMLVDWTTLYHHTCNYTENWFTRCKSHLFIQLPNKAELKLIFSRGSYVECVPDPLCKCSALLQRCDSCMKWNWKAFVEIDWSCMMLHDENLCAFKNGAGGSTWTP